MKKILKIQKNKIYFENDDEIIDISPEIKRQFTLKAGDDITLKYNEICYEAAFVKGAFLLSLKDRTKKGLKNKLDEKFFNKNAVIKAVDKLERLGYINDVDYGANFIRNRKYGRQRIIIELINRGLDRETISLAYETLESEEKEKNEEFKDIDDQKLEKAIKKAGKKEERKLIEYLLRQGFKLDRIFQDYFLYFLKKVLYPSYQCFFHIILLILVIFSVKYSYSFNPLF